MNPPLYEQILQTAIQMAESDSWESVHLFAIAKELSINLEQIRQYYPQKDDLVEAWFDRADQAVLTMQQTPEFLNLSEKERLQWIIMSWLHALAPHQRITREMLYYKFEFGHIHLQTLGILRISRTVQWFREAALIDTVGLRRIIEETGLTTIFLLSFAKWLYDDSIDSLQTEQFLDAILGQAEGCVAKCPYRG